MRSERRSPIATRWSRPCTSTGRWPTWIRSSRSQRGSGLRILEDAAQAQGATYNGRFAGTFGLGTFSFYATKNMTTGEGGMITTGDDALADRLRLLRNQGMRARYQYEMAGNNYRLTDLQAALGIPQLARYDQTIARRRQQRGPALVAAGVGARRRGRLANRRRARSRVAPVHDPRHRSGGRSRATSSRRSSPSAASGAASTIRSSSSTTTRTATHPQVRVSDVPGRAEADGAGALTAGAPALADADLDRVADTVAGIVGSSA